MATYRAKFKISRPGRIVKVPMGSRVEKSYVIEGWDLDGYPVGELSFGFVDKDPGKFGFCVVGRNNQRKTVIFDDPRILDDLIEALNKMKESPDMDVCKFVAAVRD